MNIKIHNPKEYGGNSGSCGDLVQYLEKENKDKSITEQEFFFNQLGDQFSAHKVQHILDNNHKGLKNSDSRFYMMSINPSKSELEHLIETRGLPDIKTALKEYTKNVMEEYAKAFNREKPDGRPLTGSDLLYFAKIEHVREYKPQDKLLTQPIGNVSDKMRYIIGDQIEKIAKTKSIYEHNMEVSKQVRPLYVELKSYMPKDGVGEVKASAAEIRKLQLAIKRLETQYVRDLKGQGSIILPGEIKSGNNHHVHVIVSRKDMSNEISLSPLAKSRGSKNKLNGKEVQIGFNRSQFVANCEKVFDRSFNYNRLRDESYEFALARKKGEKYLVALMYVPKSPEELAKHMVNQIISEIPIANQLNKIPLNQVAIKNKVIDTALNAALKIANVNPAGLTANVVRSVIKSAINTAIRGIDLGR